MKKLNLLFLFLSSILFGNNFELTKEEINYLNSKKIISMCVDPDWEPFEKINKYGFHEGISADIIKLISNKLNIKIELIPTKDWDESIDFSKQKKCDILSFLNETPKRKEWLVFTEPIFNDPNVLVGRIEKSYIDDISKVNLSIALPKNTAIGERFTKDFPNLTIIPTTSENEAFKLVEEQKADLSLRFMIIKAKNIKKNGKTQKQIADIYQVSQSTISNDLKEKESILKDIAALLEKKEENPSLDQNEKKTA